uniref:WD40/YVTN/BNR-like repeat-containing protein n=1 Tax=Halomonas sp. TaxID=1486246 RepID=UPI002629FCF3|nr:hypothetical protein [Halomonas sp.]
MLPEWIRPWLYAASLCYGAFAFVWYLMVGYAQAWHVEPEQTLSVPLKEPVEWNTLQATATNDGSLLSVGARGRDGEVEMCSSAGGCRTSCLAQGEVETGSHLPVFNCLVVPETGGQVRHSVAPLGEIGRQGLSYLMRTNGNQVEVVGRLKGEVSGMGCNKQGRCYLFAELAKVYNQSVFVSDDSGVHWRLAAQDVLDSASTVEVLRIDGERIWAADSGSLYFSEDGGSHWNELANARSLLSESPLRILLHNDSLVFFHWNMDETGRIYAMVSDQGRGPHSIVMFQFDQTGKVVDAGERPGELRDLVSGPDGKLYAIYRAEERERYTLYRLSAGKWLPIKASGRSPLTNLQGSDKLLLMEAGRGDGQHMLFSRDAGETWKAIEDLPYYEDKRVFDPAGAGILEFRYPNSEDHYGYRWLRP